MSDRSMEILRWVLGGAVFLIVLYLLVTGVARASFGSTYIVENQQIVVAHGDDLIFSGDDAHGYATITEAELYADTISTAAEVIYGNSEVRVWIFGDDDTLYGMPFPVNISDYEVNVDAGKLWNLEPGTYRMLIQFQGKNNRFDISYTDKHLKSIYADVETDDCRGLQPAMVFTLLKHMASNPYHDDQFNEYALVIEEPVLQVTNMYDLENGDLYISGETNLAKGNPLVARIDEELYVHPEYASMMTYHTTVVGNDIGKYRNFTLIIGSVIAPQLTSGYHTIYVHFHESGVTTIPFRKYMEAVQPTPTMIILHKYSVTGNDLGYRINITRPAATPTPVPVATQAKIYETAIVSMRDSRYIQQMDTIYIGEKNLDIEGTLGWMGESDYFQIQYCDGDYSRITIEDPNHFDVTEDLFISRQGAWCQYTEGMDENDPPVAFTVKRNPWVKINTTFQIGGVTYDDFNETITHIVNTTMLTNGSYAIIEPPEAEITDITTETMEMPAEMPIQNPYPDDAVVVPLPVWLVVVAVAIAAVMRR